MNRVAIVGVGAIGRVLAAKLDAGLPGLKLVAVAARDADKARRFLAGLSAQVPVLPVRDLPGVADIIVECAPASIFADIVEPAVDAGCKVIVSSVGALLDHEHLIARAEETGAQIIVPTGALIGLDAMTAAAEGTITSVRLMSSKPPAGLIGAPFLVEHGIDVSGISEPVRVFAGTAREAAKGFPANLNVAVALALAGIGPDRTTVEFWADPKLTRNTHKIEVVADSASFSMTIENVPSENPRTGRITALSLVALLRKMHSPLRIGS